MAGKPENSTKTVTAICALLPDDPGSSRERRDCRLCRSGDHCRIGTTKRRSTACAAALVSMRGNGFVNTARKGVH